MLVAIFWGMIEDILLSKKCSQRANWILYVLTRLG